jgi:serine O-acetyltransferase
MRPETIHIEEFQSITANGKNHSFDISTVVRRLCDEDFYGPVYHGINLDSVSMPSSAVLDKVVSLLKSVLFPGFFSNTQIKPYTMKFYIGSL